MKYSILNIEVLNHFLLKNKERQDVMTSSATGLFQGSIRCYIIMAFLSIAALTVDAQVTSPIINDNSSVTFSIFAPDADEVYLRGDFVPNGIPIEPWRPPWASAARRRNFWSWPTARRW